MEFLKVERERERERESEEERKRQKNHLPSTTSLIIYIPTPLLTASALL
jgi:hypothetical protein